MQEDEIRGLITEKWLMSIGGWAACGEAKRLAAAGAVPEPELRGDLLKGLVKSGARDRVAGFRINGRTDVDNLCHCPEARRSGAMCAHSLAVAYAWLKPPAAAKTSPASTGTAGGKASPAAQALAATTGESTGLDSPPLPSGFTVRFDGDFAAIFRKGKIPVRLACEARDTPTLAAHPLGRWLAARGLRQFPALVVLPASEGPVFLAFLKGHGGVFQGEAPVAVGTSPVRLPLTLRLAENGEGVSAALALEPPGQLLWTGEGGWLMDAGGASFWPLAEMPRPVRDRLAPLLEGKAPRVDLDFPWLAVWGAALGESLAFADGESREVLPRVRAGKPEIVVEGEGSLNHLALRVRVVYDGGPAFSLVDPAAPQAGFPYLGPRPGLFLTRDAEAEAVVASVLREHGFQASAKDQSWQLSGERDLLRWHLHGAARLREAGAALRSGERWGRVTAALVPLRPRLQWGDPGKADRAFRLEAEGGLTWEELRRLRASNRLKTELPGGRTGVIDAEAIAEWEEVLKDCRVRQTGPGDYVVPASHRRLLEYCASQWSEAPADEPVEEEAALAHSAWWNDLRPYQQTGVGWLAAILKSPSSGALLADEMGLGKTLQSLLAADALIRTGHLPPAVLVLCPTSLVENWRSEIRRFLPAARVATAASGDEVPGVLEACLARPAESSPSSPSFAIVSFGLLARREADFQGREFGLVLVDEASHLRNPKTQLAQAARRLKSRARLALTGTPVENRLTDLWSILDFVQPGYLGSQAEFRERYEKPLSKGGDPGTWRRFRRVLRPLVLRRTKQEVARDLPGLVERVVTCGLTPKQRALYQKIADESQRDLRALEQEGSRPVGELRARMLTALLRLRQVCCDARLAGAGGAGPEASAEDSSGKLALIREILPTLIDDGHRVLVFSQFVSVLKLLQAELESLKIAHEYLDGSSTQRGEIVARFQKGTAPVFLLSLKAGGYGLNLPQADQVIHFDPWWNPAVEAQATDRAHRIGQTRPVTSHKLIVAGTVEEKILQLQARKRHVFESAVDDLQPMMEGLTLEDLRGLLGMD